MSHWQVTRSVFHMKYEGSRNYRREDETTTHILLNDSLSFLLLFMGNALVILTKIMLIVKSRLVLRLFRSFDFTLKTTKKLMKILELESRLFYCLPRHCFVFNIYPIILYTNNCVLYF